MSNDIKSGVPALTEKALKTSAESLFGTLRKDGYHPKEILIMLTHIIGLIATDFKKRGSIA